VKDDEVFRLVEAAAEPEPGRILEALIQLSGADRGLLVLRDGIPVAQGMDPDQVRVSRTLISRALAEGRPLLASDADLATLESVRNQKLRSVLVLPLARSGCAVYLADGDFKSIAPLERIAASLDRALAHRDHGYGELIGRSKVMLDLYPTLDRIAAAPYPVLIAGESGTGKELVARALHRRGPYVATNCACFPEQLLASELFGHVKGAFTGAERDRDGLFVQAHGGLLFLDDVDCLSTPAQESLLRVLETGEIRRVGGSKTEKVDVRVVAATHKDLEQLDGFRDDLYYRLNVLRVDLPPLRDRREDIPLIAERRLAVIARQLGRKSLRLSAGALSALMEYSWPGNVRELVNLLERAAVLSAGDILEPSHFTLPKPAAKPAGGIASLDDHIRETLQRFGSTVELQQIADQLGISRKTLWEKKKKWGL